MTPLEPLTVDELDPPAAPDERVAAVIDTARVLSFSGIPAHQWRPEWIVTIDALVRVLDPRALARLEDLLIETRAEAMREMVRLSHRTEGV